MGNSTVLLNHSPDKTYKITKEKPHTTWMSSYIKLVTRNPRAGLVETTSGSSRHVGSAGMMVGNVGREEVGECDGAMSCNSETSKYSPPKGTHPLRNRNKHLNSANGPVKVKDSLKGSTLRTRARKP